MPLNIPTLEHPVINHHKRKRRKGERRGEVQTHRKKRSG